jgi:hypothetical protein
MSGIARPDQYSSDREEGTVPYLSGSTIRTSRPVSDPWNCVLASHEELGFVRAVNKLPISWASRLGSDRNLSTLWAKKVSLVSLSASVWADGPIDRSGTLALEHQDIQRPSSQLSVDTEIHEPVLRFCVLFQKRGQHNSFDRRPRRSRFREWTVYSLMPGFGNSSTMVQTDCVNTRRIRFASFYLWLASRRERALPCPATSGRFGFQILVNDVWLLIRRMVGPHFSSL